MLNLCYTYTETVINLEHTHKDKQPPPTKKRPTGPFAGFLRITKLLQRRATMENLTPFVCLRCTHFCKHANALCISPCIRVYLFFRYMCGCIHKRLFLFVSSVNYLQHWHCLSIVDSNGKYVSLEIWFSTFPLKTLPWSNLISHQCLIRRSSFGDDGTAFLWYSGSDP